MEKMSRIVGLRLLAIREGAECGKVREVVIDPNTKSVRFFVLDTGKGCFGLQSIAIEKVTGTGKDFCTTLTTDWLMELWENEDAMALAYSDTDIIHARVVSNMGDVIGNIADFEFDAASGVIYSYIMEDGQQLDRDMVVTLARGIVFVDADGGGASYAEPPALPAQAPAPPLELVPEPEEEMPEENPTVAAVEESAPASAVEMEPSQPEEVAEQPGITFDDLTESLPVPKEQELPAPAPEMELPEPAVEAIEEEAPVAAIEEEPPAPAPTPAPEPAAEPEEEAAPPDAGDMKSYFEKRRMQFLVGRTLKQDVVDNAGDTLAAAGDTVDDSLIELVKSNDKLNELIMSVN